MDRFTEACERIIIETRDLDQIMYRGEVELFDFIEKTAQEKANAYGVMDDTERQGYIATQILTYAFVKNKELLKKLIADYIELNKDNLG